VRHWTAARDARLHEMYTSGASADGMVAELGTTIAAIYNRASQLKLKRVAAKKRLRLQPSGRPQRVPLAELVPAFRRWLDENGFVSKIK